jgi:hypothetical protein
VQYRSWFGDMPQATICSVWIACAATKMPSDGGAKLGHGGEGYVF